MIKTIFRIIAVIPISLLILIASCKKNNIICCDSPDALPSRDTIKEEKPDYIYLESYKYTASDTAGNFIYSYGFKTGDNKINWYIYTPGNYNDTEWVTYIPVNHNLFKDSVIERKDGYLTVEVNNNLYKQVIFNTSGDGYIITGKKHYVKMAIDNTDSGVAAKVILAAYDKYIRMQGYKYSRYPY